ncbi:hypothetical protein CB1_000245042 [Camelus ferus]|nr:hypothetical protein CB1_000245042 [Camelus ferus]
MQNAPSCRQDPQVKGADGEVHEESSGVHSIFTPRISPATPRGVGGCFVLSPWGLVCPCVHAGGLESAASCVLGRQYARKPALGAELAHAHPGGLKAAQRAGRASEAPPGLARFHHVGDGSRLWPGDSPPPLKRLGGVGPSSKPSRSYVQLSEVKQGCSAAAHAPDLLPAKPASAPRTLQLDVMTGDCVSFQLHQAHSLRVQAQRGLRFCVSASLQLGVLSPRTRRTEREHALQGKQEHKPSETVESPAASWLQSVQALRAALAPVLTDCRSCHPPTGQHVVPLLTRATEPGADTELAHRLHRLSGTGASAVVSVMPETQPRHLTRVPVQYVPRVIAYLVQEARI